MIIIVVFGITGTNGKTSTSYILRQLLWERGESVALIGTISHNTGDRVYEAVNTTPSKVLLSEYFDEMTKGKINNCIMEVSSHGIAQNRIENVVFSYGAFTNLSRDHLDYHSDMEEYYKVKESFIESTIIGNVINIDDESGFRLYQRLLANKSSEKKLCSVSLKNKEADIYGEIKNHNLVKSDVVIYINGKLRETVSLHMLGKASVYNMLVAVGLALISSSNQMTENENFDYIKKGIDNFFGVPGRYELIDEEGCPDIIVDYAHTPDALENLLMEVKENSKSRIITIFGCGGDRDRGKRSIMGRIAGQLSDYCILTSDNPRSEKPLDIINEIEKGIIPTGCPYCKLEGRYQAISRGVFMAEKDDVIVIAGKGHETMPFNDGEVAKILLKKYIK